MPKPNPLTTADILADPELLREAFISCLAVKRQRVIDHIFSFKVCSVAAQRRIHRRANKAKRGRAKMYGDAIKAIAALEREK